MYACRVAWGGTIKPDDDAPTVLWTAAPTATKAATATARKTRAANERDDRPRADVQRRPVQQDLRPRRLHQPQISYFRSLTAANHNRRALDYSRPGELKQELRRACELRGAVWSLTPAKNTSRRCARCGTMAKEHRESQAALRCRGCGHTANADANAAENIRQGAVRWLLAKTERRKAARRGAASTAPRGRRKPAAKGSPRHTERPDTAIGTPPKTTTRRKKQDQPPTQDMP